MSLSVPDAVLDAIRFEANYETYESMLMRLDPIRFRGLGPENRERFIRHAVAVCDRWQLHFVNDVAYVMFVMTFLGSYFYEDMRYTALATELTPTADGADTRIERLRARFITMGQRFIGHDLALYRRDLGYFRDNVLPAAKDFDAARMLAALTASHGGRSYTPTPDQQALYLQQAQAAVEGLGFEDPEGLKLCTALGYWLGGGFWKDPLYPWVPEMAASAGAPGVMNYALRRLDRQLKPREDRNV